MISFSILIITGTTLLVAGTYLISYNLLVTGVELLVKTWRRAFLSWAGRRLRAMGLIQEKPFQARPVLDWQRVILFVMTLTFGLAVKDVMLTPLVLAIGLAVLAWVNFQHCQVERSRVNEDAEVVALQVRALMSVDSSLLGALRQVKLAPGQMKSAISQVERRLQMQQPPAQAAQALKGLPGNVTSRLASLISNSARLTRDVQDSLLLSLEQEAHRQKLLRSKMRQTLSLVRGTIRLLQGAVAAALAFVMLTPAWRDFFLVDLPHRAILAFLICGVALASLYFEHDVYQLSVGEVA